MLTLLSHRHWCLVQNLIFRVVLNAELHLRPIEMAQEFPHVDWTGVDLFPMEKDNLPPNLEFLKMDATMRLDYPDNYFDLIHSRALVAGVNHPFGSTDLSLTSSRSEAGQTSSRKSSASLVREP